MKKLLLTTILLLTVSTPAFAFTTETNYNNQWRNDKDLGGWTYYIDNQKVTGVQNIKGTEYYFDVNGKLTTGWIQAADKKIYTSNQGIVQHGWKLINGNWYFFNPLGYMEHDIVIDGYTIDSRGTWVR